MKYLIAILLFTFLLSSGKAQKIKIENPVRFLALGDSYTIGQSVPAYDRWPNQLASQLTNMGYNVTEVKIIAQTGWRTDNLNAAIEQEKPLNGFNLVSLLIGVNNQYQRGSTSTYFTEFEDLLKKALLLASNKPEHVFVLSIPDYAYTPFGGGNSSISSEIDQFNSINKMLTESYKVKYIDITPISRMGILKPELVASDRLHPSGIMYGLWVQEILKSVENELSVDDNPTSDKRLSYSISQRQLTINSYTEGSLYYIFNSSGQLVQRGVLSEKAAKTADLSSLTAGLYIMRIEYKGEIQLKTKFVLL